MNASSQFHEEFRSDVLGGIVMLKHVGAAYEKSSFGREALLSVHSECAQGPPSRAEVYSVLRLGKSRRHANASVDADSSSLVKPR